MRTLTRRLVPLAVASALVLSACTSDPEGPDDSAASSSTDAAAGAEDGSGAAPGGVIGVDFPDPDDVIADATFTVPGTDDEVRVGVESLSVHGDTTELRLVFTPQFGDGDPVSVFQMLGETTNIDLVDREHLKEYRTGYTTGPTGAKAVQGESVGFQAYFSAPQDDISAIDVKLHDSWPTFEDVPLTVED